MQFKQLEIGTPFRFASGLEHSDYVKTSARGYTKYGKDQEAENADQIKCARIYRYPVPRLPLKYRVGSISVDVVPIAS